MNPMNAIFVVGYIAYMVWQVRGEKKMQRRNAELSKDVIDLRDRINKLEEYPFIQLGKAKRA